MKTWESWIRKLLFDAQLEKCPICEKDLGYDLVVDHNHETGEVRGLLHRRCNNMVAQVEIHTKKLNYIISRKLDEKIKSYLKDHIKLVVE